MKKKILIMALCASTLMPVSAWGEEAASETVTEAAQIEESEVTAVQDTVTIAEDTDVLDYPGRKEGNVIGEVLAEDEVSRTGTISDTWSRIVFEDENGEEQTGYVPNSILKGYEEESTSDGAVEAGIIHKSSGTGIFADAVEGVTQTGGDQGHPCGGCGYGIRGQLPASSWNISDHPLLPMQHLLRSLGQWCDFYGFYSRYQQDHCGRSYCDPIWL